MRDLALAMLLLPVGLALFGCPAAARPPNPIEQCTALCQSEAGKACSEPECARGCEFVLDRVVERLNERRLGAQVRHVRELKRHLALTLPLDDLGHQFFKRLFYRAFEAFFVFLKPVTVVVLAEFVEKLQEISV